MNDDKRVVALIDMDCFYVQVEEREQPENKGKPGCVVQYKNWKGGGIIAVNYEARATGITRQMRGDEARERCSDCILYRVPEQRGKADLTKYFSFIKHLNFFILILKFILKDIAMLVKKSSMYYGALEFVLNVLVLTKHT